jgi:protein gp37
MSDTKIEWTDKTWNPLTGCTKVSPGCDNCYAKTMHERFNGPGSFDTITLHPERLNQPLKWRKPARVFVNSMSDLFHRDVPDKYIADVFAVMAVADRHTFQVLTKRPARMRSLLSRDEFWQSVEMRSFKYTCEDGEFVVNQQLPNVWLGVSVENQKWADIRIPALLDTPAAVRFISAEPLLGPVDLKSAALRPYERQQGGFWEYGHGEDDYGNGKVWVPAPPAQLDWVIVGGESGPGARPMHPDWARSLRDQCQGAGVPYLFKQWGAHDASGKRVGKGKAGRELDERTWDEYPTSEPAA